jgi:hypothetical protein
MKRFAQLCTLALVCLALPATLLAADNPALGTWKLNLEKSKFPAGMAPKALTRTITADGDNVKYAFEGQAADGSAINYSFSVKYDGKDAEVAGTGAPLGTDHIAITRVNSHQFSASLKKGGKPVATSTAVVSHDGKTSTVSTKGTGADGKPFKSSSVYDKQ